MYKAYYKDLKKLTAEDRDQIYEIIMKRSKEILAGARDPQFLVDDEKVVEQSKTVYKDLLCLADQERKQIFNYAMKHAEELIAVVALPACTKDVQDALSRLADEELNERDLYCAAEPIVEWLEETSSSKESSPALFSMLSFLGGRSLRVLLGSLADSGVQLRTALLVKRIAEYLFDNDKRLAQAAAACLINCCGAPGRSLVQRAVKQNPPHAVLIAGIASLTEAEVTGQVVEQPKTVDDEKVVEQSKTC
jgi:hypothetical protein